MQKNNYIIIGASAAGIAAAKKIRSLDAEGEILCFTDESEVPYNKCLLVDWIAEEKTESEIQLHSKEFFNQQRIQILYGVRIVSLNKHERYIVTQNGERYFYTKLLLATGASPRLLTCAGAEVTGGIVPFYTAADTQKIKETIQKDTVKNIVIIGGGISGIECADALKNCGKKITVLERGPYILGRQVTHECAGYIQNKMEVCGIDVRVQSVVDAICSENGWVSGVVCNDGIKIAADCVITALGSCANLDLACGAQLEIKHDAVVTNGFLQTSDASIFAAGDCALVHNLESKTPIRSVMWPDAVAQGMVAGTNMVSLSREYKGIVPLSLSHFFGGSFVSCGLESFSNEAYAVELVVEKDMYSAIVFDQSRVVKGFIVYGKEIAYTHFKRSFLTASAV